MQFLPSTWSAYGVDGDGDGRADVNDLTDAVFGAANHLCANGGADPDRLRSALWNYNHSWGYVATVLQVAAAT
jgi:membrane-bound lytic murein transglycosylase B